RDDPRAGPPAAHRRHCRPGFAHTVSRTHGRHRADRCARDGRATQRQLDGRRVRARHQPLPTLSAARGGAVPGGVAKRYCASENGTEPRDRNRCETTASGRHGRCPAGDRMWTLERVIAMKRLRLVLGGALLLAGCEVATAPEQDQEQPTFARVSGTAASVSGASFWAVRGELRVL